MKAELSKLYLEEIKCWNRKMFVITCLQKENVRGGGGGGGLFMFFMFFFMLFFCLI